MAILVGDIGGTHTRLALAAPDGSTLIHIQRHENASAPDLESLVAAYLADTPAAPERACFAVAGPTDGSQARLTNLDWSIDADAISRGFGLRARLINDFEAVGYGLDALGATTLHTLQAGAPRAGAPRLALGAGTGLGVTVCVHGPAGYRPLPSEGGHIAFAPVDEQQITLLRSLRNEYGRVSVERILSGPGIVDLYKHCRQAMDRPLVQARSAADISSAALTGGDSTAVWAMQLFCVIYGQTAGDLALATRAEAGVYLAGGITPKILPLLEDGRFMAGFRAKGRFANWMDTVPVYVVMDPDVGLKGAALAAAEDS